MGVISTAAGTNLFWLGRYAERANTVMKTLLSYYDRTLDTGGGYQDYLRSFGLFDVYGSMDRFLESFLFELENTNSVWYALVCAYDNGIVLRDSISTETFSLLQMALDKLEEAKASEKSKRFALLDLQDYFYAFWGCLDDKMRDKEGKNIILCGKTLERLDLYIRLSYPKAEIQKEFQRLCDRLRRMPKKSPYRYSTPQLCKLVEIIEDDAPDSITDHRRDAIESLYRLFEVS